MKDHTGCRRAFSRPSKAWYADAIGGDVEVHFGMYADEAGTTGEMSMRWVSLENHKPASPKLCAFNDSWSALASFPDLLAKMAEVDDEHIDEQGFVDMLLACGFEDHTSYMNPDEGRPRTETVRRIRELEREAQELRETLNA